MENKQSLPQVDYVIFNRGKLRKTNGAYHKICKVIFAQTTGGLCVITPKNLFV